MLACRNLTCHVTTVVCYTSQREQMTKVAGKLNSLLSLYIEHWSMDRKDRTLVLGGRCDSRALRSLGYTSIVRVVPPLLPFRFFLINHQPFLRRVGQANTSQDVPFGLDDRAQQPRFLAKEAWCQEALQL